MELNKKLIIFGASDGARKVIQTLKNLHYEISALTDNNPEKWGSIFENLPVIPPSALLNKNIQILIASDYQAEIEIQLKNMGLLECLILKEELILQRLLQKLTEFKKTIYLLKESSEPNYIIELADGGICLGGIETFALMLTRALKEQQIPVKLFTKLTHEDTPDDLKEEIVIFDFDYRHYIQSVQKCFCSLVTNLPCVVITNWQSQVMMAAILVKQCYPDKIKILSIVHNDKPALYRRQAYLTPYTDIIMGVSRKINQKLIEVYGVPSTKIKYKESPVYYKKQLKRQYSLNSNIPIQIGFAARITKFQKRADLLIKLIELLEKNQIFYQLQIAGEGDYIKPLQEFLQKNHIEQHVQLLGRIAPDTIEKFWVKKDIFLSVSDFEGASISMLEAMSYGSVPVVTKVSGVKEFVKNGWNGMISEPGDIEGIFKNIKYLAENRIQLPTLGQNARFCIKTKCNLQDYITYLLFHTKGL